MFESALIWLLLNLLTIVILAFFSMEEMACVSFNKIRLQFLVKQENRRAEWLHYLLQNPSRLFGTTLIGVNVATIVGSECSRQFHQALHINPDWAPLSQIILVIIFGELAPMFAARRYSEHVALLGIPLLFFTSKLLAPFIWILGLISKAANFLIGGSEPHPELFLTQDELQKVIEDQEEEGGSPDAEEINVVAANIFLLRNKNASHVMTHLKEHPLFPWQTSIEKLHRSQLDSSPYLLIYHKEVSNIIGIAFIRELIRAPNNRKVKDYCKPPWFIAEKTPILQIIKQFRRNSEHVAIVLDNNGKAKGVLKFDDILEEIFGKTEASPASPTAAVLIDRTVPGVMTVADFNEEFNAKLPAEDKETLSQMVIRLLDHPAEVGEELLLPPFEFTVQETTLLEIKTLKVRTKI